MPYPDSDEVPVLRDFHKRFNSGIGVGSECLFGRISTWFLETIHSPNDQSLDIEHRGHFELEDMSIWQVRIHRCHQMEMERVGTDEDVVARSFVVFLKGPIENKI